MSTWLGQHYHTFDAIRHDLGNGFWDAMIFCNNFARWLQTSRRQLTPIQRKVAQIEYSPLWKALRKRVPKRSSDFQNLRLGSIKLLQKIIASQKTNTSHVATIFCNHLAKFMLPKRRFWMAERTFGNAFSNYFSKESGPNRVLTPLKSTSKTSSQTFVGLPKSSFGEHKVVKNYSINRTNASYGML